MGLIRNLNFVVESSTPQVHTSSSNSVSWSACNERARRMIQAMISRYQEDVLTAEIVSFNP